MKKLLLSVLMMTASAVFAVSSSNIFGILRVDSQLQETIISVPWLETDPASGEIKVCDLVLTSNLTVGDRLLYYTGSAAKSGTSAQDFQYYAWTLAENDGVKTWQSTKTVSRAADGLTRVTESAHDGTQPVPRGAALIIVRPTNHTDPIYLYGQYTEAAAKSVVSAGSFSQPVYTLLAPSNPNGVDLNATGVMSTAAEDCGVGANDYIVIGDVGTILHYYKGKWGVLGEYDPKNKVYKLDTTKAVVEHGQGVWYVSRGGSPTFVW